MTIPSATSTAKEGNTVETSPLQKKSSGIISTLRNLMAHSSDPTPANTNSQTNEPDATPRPTSKPVESDLITSATPRSKKRRVIQDENVTSPIPVRSQSDAAPPPSSSSAAPEAPSIPSASSSASDPASSTSASAAAPTPRRASLLQVLFSPAFRLFGVGSEGQDQPPPAPLEPIPEPPVRRALFSEANDSEVDPDARSAPSTPLHLERYSSSLPSPSSASSMDARLKRSRSNSIAGGPSSPSPPPAWPEATATGPRLRRTLSNASDEQQQQEAPTGPPSTSSSRSVTPTAFGHRTRSMGSRRASMEVTELLTCRESELGDLDSAVLSKELTHVSGRRPSRVVEEEGEALHLVTTTVDEQMESESGQHYDEEEEDTDEEECLWFIRNLPPLRDDHLVGANWLPPKPVDTPPVTLVLDLDETLVHCSTQPISNPDRIFTVEFNGEQFKVYMMKRPHLHQFLRQVSKLFEVVVFTASQRVYAEALLDLVEADGLLHASVSGSPTGSNKHNRLVRYRLYREACVYVEGNYLKDLRVLGRDLARTVIVDNSPQAFGYHLSNGIPIPSWYDDPEDSALLTLLPFLEQLAEAKDVRPLIQEKFALEKRVAALTLPSDEPPATTTATAIVGVNGQA